MKVAPVWLNQLGKSWVLDPTIVGALGFQLKACLKLIELKPTIVRGNGSEIIALSMASLGSTKIRVWS
ncbi:putative hydroxyethylthiazole kinase [Helianthus annuus]|uniref:hydroxyethylthiazole kinase n=1 Tax=Helianthus annuus TaxID=4232 RepID=A0A9K3HIE2_HELAN|nr:putative hydroxyethylthiazole kinase [Helianthus annuus]